MIRCRYVIFADVQTIPTSRPLPSIRQHTNPDCWPDGILPRVPRLLSMDSPSRSETHPFIFVPEDDSTPNIHLFDVVPVHLLSRLPKLRAWSTVGLKGSERSGRTWLSLHSSALSCYQRYGGCIRDPALADIPFDDTSDFIGPVSAFTSVLSLKACSLISFRTGKERIPSLYNFETNVVAQSLNIQNLGVSTCVDIRAVEYLLVSGAATLNNLVVIIDDCKLVCPDYLGEASDESLSNLIAF
ncbi:hypothetical protein LXA43DRAFT_674679 [Ganoderma leucocontextum]|nr:hypothetical protein LXA43DRAFT_674679 [Ganoderma leucocontextum]